MTKEEKKQLCSGCYNNFYNGNNGYNISDCWSLKKAKVCMRKEVHINDIPPWEHQRVFKTLSCYRKPKFVYVSPNQLY